MENNDLVSIGRKKIVETIQWMVQEQNIHKTRDIKLRFIEMGFISPDDRTIKKWKRYYENN